MVKTDEQWRRDFNDADYALLYRDASGPQRSDAEVDAIVGLLRLRPGARVLDLCCGQGRHAVRLRKRGLFVAGLDISAPLLAMARDAARRTAGAQGTAWVRADVRALP